MEQIYGALGISPEVEKFGEEILKGLRERFSEIDAVAEYNQGKVIGAMQKERVNADCFAGSTGYGYNDMGRDTLESVYASCFHTEAALVRPQITCGTHALTIALSANLLPGDELYSPAGKPYDTLEKVIGIRDAAPCSLTEYGVIYKQTDLLPDGTFDYAAIEKEINEKTKLVTIQRSKGYQMRPTFSVAQIGELIRFVKTIKPDVICMVDNCYGEFVETYRLSAPGLGQEVGASLDLMRGLYQGFFLAPSVVSGALKGAVFAANIYEKLGFRVIPNGAEPRHDIIQAVELGSAAAMEAFCQGIQAAAPVDSYVTPVPYAMPGYSCDVIMAAGAFIQGSSIELSADGPIREPYAVYFQGGLTWYHAKFGILMSLQKLYEAGLVKL